MNIFPILLKGKVRIRVTELVHELDLKFRHVPSEVLMTLPPILVAM